MRVAVVGAGAAGALIARELCRYQVEVVMFELAPDVGWGVTKANSGVVHAGFHDEPGTLRARLCAVGNRMYPQLARRLDLPFRRCGAWVLAFSASEVDVLRQLVEQGRANGVPGLQLRPREEVLAQETAISSQVMAGLWAPTVGITEPWQVAIAAVECAVSNGVELHLSEEVTGIEARSGRVQAVVTGRERYPVDAVVNAAGLFADQIAHMAGLREPELFPRRGEYVLLDEGSAGLVRSVLFPSPQAKSKGILVLPTVDGGLLLGPTADDLPPQAKGATETTAVGLAQVVAGARRLVPGLPLSATVKAFAGLRPESPQRDFVLGPTRLRGFYQAAALRSPGLTAAPAIASWLVREVMAAELGLREREGVDLDRKGVPRAAELPAEEWDRLIKEDPSWGRIVCSCNRVTEGEIREAIRRGARTLDGVKFRTRAGFGRCQGSFCTDRIVEIIAGELGRSPEKVHLGDSRSPLVLGRLRP
ncbi:MAG: NAD(P)/FAD-dependent oxidoreductase [Candidatus Bipolaricaulaceae bacterium]